ncbi:MAG: hypothetical protein IJH64_04295 [Oscillospiraceae bacterium]|nr:hypothetical protein [Oscillospiraceae bacterium]
MKRQLKGINILLLIEAAVLVIILGLCGAMTGFKRAGVVAVKDEKQENTETAGSSSGMSSSMEYQFSGQVLDQIEGMSTEQKVAQLFITTPEELVKSKRVTKASDKTRDVINEYPVAGLIYEGRNLESEAQVRDLLSNTTEYFEEASGVPGILAIAENGGDDHSPVAKAFGFDVEASPQELGDQADANGISDSAEKRAEYVRKLGFNTIVGPIADVADGADEEQDALTFGSDPVIAAEAVSYDISTTQSKGIACMVKCFPGIKTNQNDLSVYQSAVDAGAEIMMVTRRVSKDVTDSDKTPCCLSAKTVSMLRSDMGYGGILMTSDLSAEAVTKKYPDGKAAVKAVKAGMNLIYVRDHFRTNYKAVLEAVESGEIDENTLNAAVGKILESKLR